MKVLSASEVQFNAVRQLGLDPEAIDLTSAEAIAAGLRRAAGFMCPCAGLTLIRAVGRSSEGVVTDTEALWTLIETTLEAMVSVGDLIEMRELNDAGRTALLLYPAHPSFIMQGNSAILVGIAPEHRSPLPEEIDRRVEYASYVRRLKGEVGEDLRESLRGLGLLELSIDTWLKTPPQTSADALVGRFERLLNEAGSSGAIPGLTVIDSTRPVGYYKARWSEAGELTGRFVGRRPQPHGAELWCYVELRAGEPTRLVDLPLPHSRVRGCDEAWHLQMAIDSLRSAPQGFRVRPGPADSRVVEFFSPLPMWAQRFLDAVGERVPKPGCLFAYRIASNMDAQSEFLRSALWLEQLN